MGTAPSAARLRSRSYSRETDNQFESRSIAYRAEADLLTLGRQSEVVIRWLVLENGENPATIDETPWTNRLRGWL